MNKQKVNLIIKNMELLIQSLKLELEEESNTIKIQDLIGTPIDNYEPEYYEEP